MPAQAEEALKAEVEALRAELSRTQARAAALQESERALKDRLVYKKYPRCNYEWKFCRIAQESVASPSLEVNVIIGERLVQYYGNLYSKARVDTMDALDTLVPLNSAPELKNKILFSVIVVRVLVTAIVADVLPHSCLLYIAQCLKSVRFSNGN